MSSTADLTATESKMDIAEASKDTKDKTNTFWRKPLREKIQYIRHVITVEPLLCCYIMPSILASLAVQNMSLELACRVNSGHTNETCSYMLTNYNGDNNETKANISKAENDSQLVVAGMLSWKTAIQSAIPAILVLFIGSYSDRHRQRKPFLILPLCGEFIATIGLILCAAYRETWPAEAVAVSETLFPAVMGGSTVMLMSIYSYVADVSTIEMRTMRIGIVHITATVLFPIGSSLSGILYETIGKSNVIYLIKLILNIY